MSAPGDGEITIFWDGNGGSSRNHSDWSKLAAFTSIPSIMPLYPIIHSFFHINQSETSNMKPRYAVAPGLVNVLEPCAVVEWNQWHTYNQKFYQWLYIKAFQYPFK
jgi:hypothetical protein